MLPDSSLLAPSSGVGFQVLPTFNKELNQVSEKEWQSLFKRQYGDWERKWFCRASLGLTKSRKKKYELHLRDLVWLSWEDVIAQSASLMGLCTLSRSQENL